MREAPDIAAAFVRTHEACKLTPYLDVGGVASVGFGHTGPDVKLGAAISQPQAEIYLGEDLHIAARRLARVVDGAVISALTDNQYAALLSFVFNVGCDPAWTIWKLLNARQFDQVPAQLNRFVNAGGRKVQGLVNRRAAEVVLWSTAEPGSAPDSPPSSVTRVLPTPPTPAPAPRTSLGAHMTACVGVVGAACAQYAQPAKQAADQLGAFAAAPLIQHVVTALLTVAGIATLVGIAASEAQRRQARR